MNTQENNKMIAEFMDYTHVLLPVSVGLEYYDGDEMEYYTDWNWLMPVVDKIEDVSEGFKWVEVEWISYTFQIENKSVTIWKHSDRFDSKRIIEINGNTKREATYKAVVEFINQYNKNESFD